MPIDPRLTWILSAARQALEEAIEPSVLDTLEWDAAGKRWWGRVEVISGRPAEVAVHAGRRDPAVALALAKLAVTRIAPRIDEARAFAARELLEYYNVFNAHLRNGEQLDEETFAGRLELEAIEFTYKGSSFIEFRHSLYRGFRNFEGGLILVIARFDGEFRKAAWVSAADAEEMRRNMRCRCMKKVKARLSDEDE